MLVQNVIQKLMTERAEIDKKILSIQAECSHPKEARDEKPGSNTGNYDPSADCYWITYHCTLCDKTWTVDQ